MNRLEIQTEVRQLLAEETAALSYATNANITSFIYDGIKDLCEKGLVYEETEVATIEDGIATYSLPFNFIKAVALFGPNNLPLDPISPLLQGRVYIIAGKPLYFYITQTSFTPTIRANSTLYTLGTIIIPATVNGFLYEVTAAGISGGAPPIYPILPGSSIADGAATLTCREMFTSLYTMTLVDTPTIIGGGTGLYTLIFNAMDEGLYVDTDSPNFPENKHRLLVPYVCFRCAERARDRNLASAYYQEYAIGAGLPMSDQEGGQ
jgi:hypothetical protein